MSMDVNGSTTGTTVCRYHFEDNGDDDWMTRYFFRGGTMPSLDLFLYFQQHLAVESVSFVNGVHYSRTLEQWLQKQDRTEKALMPLFQARITAPDLHVWFAYELLLGYKPDVRFMLCVHLESYWLPAGLEPLKPPYLLRYRF